MGYRNMKKATWQEEYIQMIDDCEDRESKLSEWDINFLESIRNRVEQGISPTDRQTKVLENIWEKSTKDG